ncbi:MAG TPA: aspartyl/asparaginyl beta-hydroxylase domain-containing protein [Lysobacter sp.]|nr:aspartyl/asparaginyl beta-hydroxylase domain-containing protein [Lysobacter sp.]
MKLPAPFIQLPLLFDAQELAAEIAAVDETVWRPHPQGFPGNSMLPLVAVDGDAANEAFAGQMAPTPELLRSPYLQQVLAAMQVTVGRTRLMRLAGQAEVTRHIDQGYYWVERVRVHVPIVTQPTVRFECGDAAVNMAAGECWIFDTWRQHRVLNDASAARIHLVVDTVGGGEFWQAAARGRTPGASSGGWAPRLVPKSPDPSPPAIPFESQNLPTVMTPWELGTHLRFLLDEARVHPVLPVLNLHVQQLVRVWRGLWAQHGDAEPARASYRSAFDAFAVAVRALSGEVVLRNDMRWFDVMMVMLGRSVVAGIPPGAGSRGMPANAGPAGAAESM